MTTDLDNVAISLYSAKDDGGNGKRVLTLAKMQEAITSAIEHGINPNTPITITAHDDGIGEDCLETVEIDDVCFWGNGIVSESVVTLRPVSSLVTAASIEEFGSDEAL